MISLYCHIENLWFKIPQKLRFLLVGGFNTLVSYLLFVWFVDIIKIPYQLSLIILYFLTVNISIFTMRYYVFRSNGRLSAEYSKAWAVYLTLFLLNYAFLFLTADCLNLNILLAQALYVVLSTIITFLVHKYITFKKTG